MVNENAMDEHEALCDQNKDKQQEGPIGKPKKQGMSSDFKTIKGVIPPVSASPTDDQDGFNLKLNEIVGKMRKSPLKHMSPIHGP